MIEFLTSVLVLKRGLILVTGATGSGKSTTLADVLNSGNAYQTLPRLMNFFPGERHEEIFLQLAMCLRASVSQRLIPAVDGKRIASVEILRDTPWVEELIKSGQVDNVKDGMLKGSGDGHRRPIRPPRASGTRRGRNPAARGMAPGQAARAITQRRGTLTLLPAVPVRGTCAVTARAAG